MRQFAHAWLANAAVLEREEDQSEFARRGLQGQRDIDVVGAELDAKLAQLGAHVLVERLDLIGYSLARQKPEVLVESVSKAACAAFEVDALDLSDLASEYGRVIYPCKACVSTAMPLCHWPCSCYPNHALGQSGDWMNELYPRWVAAHGVMILCPVNWYQAPSGLKLMIDRLVCADGGNPDPTSTGGKDPARAKALELAGWDYPKHLAGRAFAVVVHGDVAGVEELTRILVDWLTYMELVPAGPSAGLGRYLGYYEPYATSHDDLDRDRSLQIEVKNQALALVETVRQIRSGRYQRPDEGLEAPRQK